MTDVTVNLVPPAAIVVNLGDISAVGLLYSGKTAYSLSAGVTFAYGEIGYIHTDGTVLKAQSDGTEIEARATVICVQAGGILSGASGLFSSQGFISGLSGGTAGVLAYASATAGAIDATQPAQPFPKPVGRWLSATLLYFAPISEVSRPATTDNAVARWDGTGGVPQNSTVIITDAGAVSGVTSLAMGGALSGVTTIANSGTQTSTATGSILESTAASTSYKYVRLTNTGGTAYFGVESSVSGAFFTGSTAYDATFWSPGRVFIRGATGIELSGAISTANNISQTGATTLSTGTGGVSLNGSTTIATGKTLTVTDLTSTRIPIISTAGLITDSAKLTFASDTMVLGDATSFAQIALNKIAGQSTSLIFRTGGVNRWFWQCNSTAESGSDAGSDLVLAARGDAGATIDSPITIARVAGGSMTITRPFSQTGATAFSTGTGTNSLNGDVVIATGKKLTVSMTTALDTDYTNAFGTPYISAIGAANANYNVVALSNYNGTVGGRFIGAHTRGTGTDANTIVANGDEIAYFGAHAADGAVYREAGYMAFYVDGTPGSGDMPTSWKLFLCPDGSVTPAAVITALNTKAVTFAGAVTTTGLLTASSGIAFANETLANYDEGTFTPTFVGTGTAGTFTYESQLGRYTRVGDKVSYSLHVQISAISVSPTGDLTIAGLPFAAAGGRHAATIGLQAGITQTATYTQFALYGESGESRVYVTELKSGGAITFTPASALGAASNYVISGTYEVS